MRGGTGDVAGQWRNDATLSDGTAGGIESKSITLSFVHRLVDQWVTVTEPEIGRAMVAIMRHEHRMVEGSAAAAYAAVMNPVINRQWVNKRVVVVMCGSNVSYDTITMVMKQYGSGGSNA